MKTTLPPGIQSISGSMKSKSQNGVRIIFKTYTRRNGKPETRMYLRTEESLKRKTPPSEKEITIRNRFAEMSHKLNALTDEQKQQYADEWMRSKYKFNGKLYKTLRGYIMARLFADSEANRR